MDIVAIQRILNEAVREYALVGNVPTELIVSLLSVDIYRKLNAKPVVHTPRTKKAVEEVAK